LNHERHERLKRKGNNRINGNIGMGKEKRKMDPLVKPENSRIRFPILMIQIVPIVLYFLPLSFPFPFWYTLNTVLVRVKKTKKRSPSCKKYFSYFRPYSA